MRVRYFGDIPVYINQDIENRYTKIAIEHFESMDTLDQERKNKYILSKNNKLNQGDFNIKQVKIYPEKQINQIRDSSYYYIPIVWVGKPVFNERMNKAILMEAWNYGELASEGRIFIFTKRRNKWKIKDTIIKWL